MNEISEVGREITSKFINKNTFKFHYIILNISLYNFSHVAIIEEIIINQLDY
jgi:hypothetical protein